jgi:hypothetical protein
MAAWACHSNISAKLLAGDLAVNITYLNKVTINFK